MKRYINDGLYDCASKEYIKIMSTYFINNAFILPIIYNMRYEYNNNAKFMESVKREYIINQTQFHSNTF